MFFQESQKVRMPTPAEALPGRDEAMPVPAKHFVLGGPLVPPFPAGSAMAMFGLGCFWGAERKFWAQPGVVSTAVGYAAGFTPNATYKEVCSGRTGHNEVVRVVYDPSKLDYEALLKVFWENHDPTQGMRQGNDVGTQYRSAIFYTTEEQKITALETIAAVNLSGNWPGTVVTEVTQAGDFWEAEPFHQDYIERYPNGYTCHYSRPHWTLKK